MSTSPAPITTAPVVDDQAPNKAITAFVGFLATLAVQWATTGHFTLDQEGVTAIAAVIVPALVYWVSNRRQAKVLSHQAGQSSVDLLIKVLCLIIVVALVVWVLERLL